MTFPRFLLTLAAFGAAWSTSTATITVSPPYGTNMVLQRGKPVPIAGKAEPNKPITVTFNGQTKTTTSDTSGNWQVMLDAMVEKATGGSLTATETGANTVTLTNVVVGDVWICGGQSNMAFGLGSCNRQVDIDSANYPVMRQFTAPTAISDAPLKTVTGSWSVCSPTTASSFSAVAFYFGRKICQDQSSAIPIGLYVSSVGGTKIDPWLGPEGATDIPVLAPLYSQTILPTGPFSLFNGMVYPYASLPARGLVWYQGENGETTTQSTDSYFLKMKALSQAYKRMSGMDDFAFYFVQLANYGTLPVDATPVLTSGGWDADTRLQQANAMGLPHSGMASAVDIGESADMHPKDKLDVGERLALWALKNEYGRSIAETSGPILKDVTISGSTLVCSFDHLGSGLMVGSKTPYSPTVEVTGGTLLKFSISGATGTWYAATATIVGDTVVVSSPSVSTPRRVAYASWQNPLGCNLYNKDGLPASPFYVDDVTAKFTVTATAGTGGSISSAGAATYLKRKPALYTITPDAGSYIADVKVDNVSVGAVKYYTFDPLYANHTIAATFAASAPSFTVSASASAGGTVTPSGPIAVAQGSSQTFSITPNSGNLVALSADGQPMGARNSFTFSDVRENHALSVVFSCAINSQAGYGGTIRPNGTNLATYGVDQTYTIAPITGYAISKVTVDGVNVGALSSYTIPNVTGPHAITASFVPSGGSSGSGSVPQQSEVVLSCLTDSLPASGAISSWATDLPAGQSLTAMGSPTEETVDDRKFALNRAVDGDGFRFGNSYSSSIACPGGASIVVAAKPTRYGTDNNWQSIVDVFYDRLVLGIMNGSGKICVRRNGSIDMSSTMIPEGQTTILSLVVQPSGAYKVYANGTQVMNITTTSDMTALVPGVSGGAGGYGTYINVGRNNSDTWTTFNGDIGDIFLYKTALTDADRVSLESYLVNRLAPSANTSSLGVTSWRSVASHGGVPRTLPVASDTFVDPRASGIRRLEVVFAKPITVSDLGSVVTVTGINSAGTVNLTALGITVNASVSSSTLVLEFSNASGACALPDAAKWRFTLNPAKITGTDGAVLTAGPDTSRVLAGLVGDFDGNGRVSGIDLNELSRVVSFDAQQADSLRADIDGDGILTTSDRSAAWLNRASRVDVLAAP